MSLKINLTVGVLLCLASCANAANILVMLPLPLFSHTNNYVSVFKELAARGHNVTMVSPFPQKTPVPNMTDIAVNNILEEMMAMMDDKDVSQMTGWFFDLFGLWLMFPNFIERIMKEEPVRRVIQDTTSSYDLVITETFFGHEIFVALGHKYNAHVVTITAHGIHNVMAHYTGNHLPPSYVPNMKFPFSDKMTFLERAKNTFFYAWEVMGNYVFYVRKQDAMMRKYFVYPGSENLPPLDDMLKSISLTIIESHPALTYPRPLQNNVVEVGGLNLKTGAKLPSDLQKFMDDAPEGVVYFSLGSHFKTTTLNSSVTSAIISVFGKLKQKVLMKWEEDTMPGQTKNIKFAKWFPQPSVLGHPNIRAFVCHGGLHGVTEGFFHGVPLVGVPIFADQKFNLKFVEEVGAGIALDLQNFSEQKFSEALNKVLYDKSFKANAMERSMILRDRPVNALDNAVFWIEYVIRHNGAHHLRPAVLDQPWYQFFLLDVLAFFALILFAVLLVVFFTICLMVKCFNIVFPKAAKKNLKKKSKKE